MHADKTGVENCTGCHKHVVLKCVHSIAGALLNFAGVLAEAHKLGRHSSHMMESTSSTPFERIQCANVPTLAGTGCRLYF